MYSVFRTNPPRFFGYPTKTRIEEVGIQIQRTVGLQRCLSKFHLHWMATPVRLSPLGRLISYLDYDRGDQLCSVLRLG